MFNVTSGWWFIVYCSQMKLTDKIDLAILVFHAYTWQGIHILFLSISQIVWRIIYLTDGVTFVSIRTVAVVYKPQNRRAS